MDDAPLPKPPTGCRSKPPAQAQDPPIWMVLKNGLLAALSAHNWMI
jgi:hypothetical protein